MATDAYYEIPMSTSYYERRMENESPRVQYQHTRKHYTLDQRDQKRTKTGALDYVKKNKFDILLFIMIIVTIVLLCIQIALIFDHFYDDRNLYAKIRNYLASNESQRVEVWYIDSQGRSSTLSAPIPKFNVIVNGTII